MELDGEVGKYIKKNGRIEKKILILSLNHLKVLISINRGIAVI